jgi:hypothetical protein
MRPLRPLEKVYWLRLVLGIVAALLCTGYLVATGGISTNLVQNPSVETGEAGAPMPSQWIASGNDTEWKTDYFRTGSTSLRINVINASANWTSSAIAVREGYAYWIRGFFKGEVKSDGFFLTVRWFSDLEGSNFKAENNTSLTVGNYSSWIPVGDSFTAPGEAKSCEIGFRAVNASGDLYGDDFEVRQAETLSKFFYGSSLMLVTYMISYYAIKSKFITQVEKPQKLVTTGIGIYLLSWLAFWVLLYTMIAG